MILHLTCACGRRLRVESRFAGRKVKCPQCGNNIVVPISSPASGSNSGNAPPASTTVFDEEDVLKWLGPADGLHTTDEIETPNVSSMLQDFTLDVPSLNEDATDWLAPLENIEGRPFQNYSIPPVGRSAVSSDSHAAQSRPRVGHLWGRIVSTDNIGQRIAAGIILLIFLAIAGNMIQRSGGILAVLPSTDSATEKTTQTERDVNVAFEALQNLGMQIYIGTTGSVEWENGRKVHDSRQQQTVLVLSGDQIKDADLIHLVTYYQGVQALGNHVPEVLVLSDTAVSDAGIPHLSRLTGLQELNVANTKMSEQGIVSLRETLGKHGTVIRSRSRPGHAGLPSQTALPE